MDLFCRNTILRFILVFFAFSVAKVNLTFGAIFNFKQTDVNARIEDYRKGLKVANQQGHEQLGLYLDSIYQKFVLDGFEKGQVPVLIELGYYRFDSGQMSIAYDDFERSYQLALKVGDRKNVANALGGMGTIAGSRGNMSEASEHLLKALEIFEEIKDTKGIGGTYLKLGMVNLRLQEYEPALELFEKALSYALPGDTANAITIYNNIGAVYLSQDMIDESIEYFNKALEVSTNPQHEPAQLLALSNLSTTSEYKDNLEQAKSYYDRAITLAQKHGMAEQELILLSNQNRLAIKNNENPQKLIKDITNTLEQAKLMELYDVVDLCLNQLISVHKGLNNYPEIIRLMEEKIDVNSLRYDKQKTREVRNLQSVYELNKSNAELESLREKMVLKENADRYFFLTLIVLLMGLISTLILNARNKAINKQLKSKEIALLNENRVKDRLFSIIGHDINSVFASQHMGLNLLDDALANQPQNQEAKNIVDKLQHNFADLDHILQTLLHWGKLQLKGGYLQKSSFDTTSIIKETLQQLRLKIEAKNLSIDNQISGKPQIIYADENHFRFIFRNILSNAIKYSYQDGKITLELNSDAKRGMHIFSVRDRGIGIPEIRREHIFSPSNLSQKGTENEEGNSLALMIAKEFMTMHEGQIWFESDSNTGTVFYFEFPFEVKAETQ